MTVRAVGGCAIWCVMVACRAGAMDGARDATPGGDTTMDLGQPDARLDSGSDRGADSSAPPVSFTALYEEVLSLSCAGEYCHNPGAGHAFRMWTRDIAYQDFQLNDRRTNVVAQLEGTRGPFMPPPPAYPLARDLIDRIKAWVDAGWPDN